MKEFRPSINLGIGSSRHGKSTMMVKCPFCEEEYEVYIWSFAGSGKDALAERYLEDLLA